MRATVTVAGSGLRDSSVWFSVESSETRTSLWVSAMCLSVPPAGGGENVREV